MARPRRAKAKKAAKRDKAKPRASRKVTAKPRTLAAPRKPTKSRKPAAPRKPRKPAPPAKSRKPSKAKPKSARPAKKPAPRKPTTKQPSERELARKRKARRDADRDRRFAAEAEAERKRARRRELYRERRDRELGRIDERKVAIGWLEHMRDDIASVFPVSLEVTEAGGGHAELDGREARLASGTPWLVVGRFEPQEEIDYATLAEGWHVVYDDLPLAVAIGEQRLTQIRVVFHDPQSGRSEGDSVVSKIGAYEFVISELIRELVGGVGIDVEHPDDESLAARYKETIVPVFYVFLSSQTTSYRDVSPSAKTATIRLR